MSDKPCTKCGTIKPLDQFYAATGTRDGRRGDCIGCFKAARLRRHAERPELDELARQRTARWISENQERYRSYKAWYSQSDMKKLVDRRSHLRRKFGLTPQQYDEMLVDQGGGCAICGKRPRPDISLHIDHDHKTGRIRSLLCFTCNNGLGQFREDIDLLFAAATYVGANKRIDELKASAKTARAAR